MYLLLLYVDVRICDKEPQGDVMTCFLQKGVEEALGTYPAFTSSF